MKRSVFLEQIWGGSVTLFEGGEPGEIARGVMALLPVRTVSLRNAGSHELPRIMSEAEELLPGLTLGDVLGEELGIDVPFGALIVFEEVATAPEGLARDHDAVEAGKEAILGHLVPGTARPPHERETAERARRAAQIAAGFRDGALNEQFFGAATRAVAKADDRRQLSRGDRAIG